MVPMTQQINGGRTARDRSNLTGKKRVTKTLAAVIHRHSIRMDDVSSVWIQRSHPRPDGKSAFGLLTAPATVQGPSQLSVANRSSLPDLVGKRPSKYL